MQKYRADLSEVQSDGARVWRSDWMGGKPIAKIENCLLENLEGGMRRTVYAIGEPDTWFSVPAVCKIQGCAVNGYITTADSGNLVFRHTYYGRRGK